MFDVHFYRFLTPCYFIYTIGLTADMIRNCVKYREAKELGKKQLRWENAILVRGCIDIRRRYPDGSSG
jgi:hypothetical protein